MSLNFKTDLKKMRENDPAGEERLDKGYRASENYDTPSHVRNLCFVWPDGRMKFMNYAYLISGEFLPNDNTIFLISTMEKILIKGVNLQNLFYELIVNFPKKLFCLHRRYENVCDSSFYIIEEIQFLNNE